MAKLNVKTGGQQLFTVWTKQADTFYAKLQSDIGVRIESMRASGMSNQAIFDSISKDIDSEVDIFSSFSGGIEGANNDLLHMSSQMASNSGVEGSAELFVWTLDPLAEHCDDCLKNSEKNAMPFPEWEALGLPGMGATECGEYCKCSLDPATSSDQTGQASLKVESETTRGSTKYF